MTNNPADNGNPEPLLTTREVAAWFHVGERTVFDWVAHRGLPVRRLVGTVRFERAAVEAWMDSQDAAKAV